MTRIFHWLFYMKDGSHVRLYNIRLVFTLPPRDSELQYKTCVNFWKNFPCITTLHKHKERRPCLQVVHLESYVSSESSFERLDKFWSVDLALTLLNDKYFLEALGMKNKWALILKLHLAKPWFLSRQLIVCN